MKTEIRMTIRLNIEEGESVVLNKIIDELPSNLFLNGNGGYIDGNEYNLLSSNYIIKENRFVVDVEGKTYEIYSSDIEDEFDTQLFIENGNLKVSLNNYAFRDDYIMFLYILTQKGIISTKEKHNVLYGKIPFWGRGKFLKLKNGVETMYEDTRKEVLARFEEFKMDYPSIINERKKEITEKYFQYKGDLINKGWKKVNE